MKNVIKKIAMLSMLVSIAGNTSLLMSSQKPVMDDKQKNALQTQVNSLSQQFATLAKNAGLNDQLKAQYKDLATTMKSLKNQFQQFRININKDEQYIAYKKDSKNQKSIYNIELSLMKLADQLEHISFSAENVIENKQMEQQHEQMEQDMAHRR